MGDDPTTVRDAAAVWDLVAGAVAGVRIL